jgi:hypothetical protein
MNGTGDSASKNDTQMTISRDWLGFSCHATGLFFFVFENPGEIINLGGRFVVYICDVCCTYIHSCAPYAAPAKP